MYELDFKYSLMKSINPARIILGTYFIFLILIYEIKVSSFHSTITIAPKKLSLTYLIKYIFIISYLQNYVL